MNLVRFLIRLLLIAVGAFIGVGLFLFAVVAFIGFLLFSLVTGRKPDLKFRVNQNPWAARRAPAGDVVDIEAREVPDAEPLPLRPPEQR